MNQTYAQQGQQQNHFQQQSQGILPEKDMLYTILSDLKRTAREYTTAATESKNPQIRQKFTSLLQSTMNLQGHLYQHMQQHNMYNASSPVLRQEIEKQIRQYAQTEQETLQFVQQKLSSFNPISGGQQQTFNHQVYM